MPKRSVGHVHRILLEMIRQDFTLPAQLKSKTSKGDPEKTHIWEVRHAGLLGLKYEVAVRSDTFTKPEIKEELSSSDGTSILRGVVDAAILG